MKYLGTLFILLFLTCAAKREITTRQEALSLKRTNPTERLLIMERESDKPMSVVENITKHGDFFLHQKALPVDVNDEVVRRLSQRMRATLDSVPGVGIAAPQVGISRKVIIVQRLDKENEPFEVYLNPEITDYSKDKTVGWEGCLSIPAGFGKVERSKEATIRHETPEGVQEERINGFTAIIFQHEIDHLNGVLFIDKLAPGFKDLVPEEEYRKMKKKARK